MFYRLEGGELKRLRSVPVGWVIDENKLTVEEAAKKANK